MTQEEFHKRFQYNSNTDCLGEGGFGKVYKAYDTHRDRYVAIKMAEVKPHLEEVRLKKEVEIISKLPSHPNIAYYEDCYTFSTFAGEYDFGVLQYYEEGNLQQLLADKQLSYEQKDSLLKQILEGIIFLHSQGIIHRDIKPQNILISNRNGKYIPKITDFGISKKLDVNKSTFFTNSLAGAGTLSFSSPEQLLGNTIRKNTDLWSFGVIACWLFTGNLPFNTGNQTVTSEAGRIELFKQITSGDITSILQQLPSAWQMLVKQCIVVDNERRINSASECLDFFENKLSGEIKIELKTEKSETTSNTTIDNKLNTTSVSINDQYKSRKNRIISPLCDFIDIYSYLIQIFSSFFICIHKIQYIIKYN
jgi:serine/threonine protein kinase